MEVSSAVRELLDALTKETRPALITLLTDRIKKAKTPKTKLWANPPNPVKVVKSLSPRIRVNTPGHPHDYYCGGCVRRLSTDLELNQHAWTDHPHHPFFGVWPLLIPTKLNVDLNQTMSLGLTYIASEVK